MAKPAKADDPDKIPEGIHKSIADSLIATARALKAEMDEPRGELGSFYKDRVEGVHGLNRKAFKAIQQLESMEDTQRDDWLRTFDQLRRTRDWDDQSDLFEDRKPAEDQPKEDQQATNVRRLRSGIKQLETEGGVQ